MQNGSLRRYVQNGCRQPAGGPEWAYIMEVSPVRILASL